MELQLAGYKFCDIPSAAPLRPPPLFLEALPGERPQRLELHSWKPGSLDNI